MQGPIKRLVKRLRASDAGRRTFEFDGLKLTVDANDRGGTAYDSRPSYEAVHSPLWADVERAFHPRTVLDIGANYGFTALVFARSFPDAQLILVEPTPALQPYLARNMEQNGLRDYELLRAVCGEEDRESITFCLNPRSSQGSRVRPAGKGWTPQEAPQLTVSRILRERDVRGFVFIKTDTQGYEERVFAGAEEFLLSRSQWLVRMEFAPRWLESQGTDPAAFLASLLSKYRLAELPARTRYRGDTVEGLFNAALGASDAGPFTRYIRSLNKNGTGWCEVLVRPRAPGSDTEA